MNVELVVLESEYPTISVIYISENSESIYDCWVQNFEDMAEMVILKKYSDIESLMNIESDLLVVALEGSNPLNSNVIDKLSTYRNIDIKLILTSDKSFSKYSENADVVIQTSKNLDDSLNALIWNFFACQFGLSGIDFADIRSVLLSSKCGVLNTYQIDTHIDWIEQEVITNGVSGAFTSFTLSPKDNICNHLSGYGNRNKSLSRDDAVNIIGFPMREKLPRGLEGNVFEITMTS